jgi:hypothetical protein
MTVEQRVAERLGFSLTGKLYAESSAWEHAMWRELVRMEEENAKLKWQIAKAILIASENGHAPCRCGGIGREGVCSNTCSCEWAKEIRVALGRKA